MEVRRAPHRSSGLPLLLLAWLVALPQGLLPGGALAKPPADKRPDAAPTDPREQAKQLLQAGQVALAAQDFKSAAQSLFGAYRIVPSVGTLFTIGQLALAQGRIVDAQDLMRRFLRDTAEPGQSPAVREAQRILALPAPPSGEVNLSGERGAVVLIDDRPVGVLPLPLPLLMPLGEHRVVVERDALRLEEVVKVLAGRTLELRCQFHPGVMVVTIPPALLVLTAAPGASGPLGEKPAAQLEQTVAQLAQRAHLSALKQTDALFQAPKQAECLDSLSCQVELMNQNLVQHALRLYAAQRPGSKSDWELTVALLDATVGDAAAELHKECSSCSADRVAELLGQLADEALQQGLTRPHGMLELDSSPAGAEVSSDGHRLGVTPIRRTYFTGALPLTFTRDGYHKKNASVTVEEGKTASLQLTLEPGSDRAPPRFVTRTEILPRPRWRLALGGAAIGVGVVLAGFGGSALAVDGRCVPGSYVGDNCPNVYTTAGVGSGLIVGGVLLVAGGVTLVAIPGKRHEVQVPVSEPAIGGGGGTPGQR